jgi:predicted Rossmann-fold nucleotide-binding protein
MLEHHTLDDVVAAGTNLRDHVIQSVDFRGAPIDWEALDVSGAVFLGCRFDDPAWIGRLVERGALVFPRLVNRPYDAYRPALYTWQELRTPAPDGSGRTLDLAIYEHFESHGRDQAPIVEALAQRIHDHAIDDALRAHIAGKRIVGIMGGHSAKRTSDAYRAAAEAARGLTRAGYVVASGGGPGVMEAANLGAWLAPHPDEALATSLAWLAEETDYAAPGYEACAQRVLAAYPAGAESLAVPTWFYGHEPSNLFGTHIAKYFSNSLREDGLLAIAVHGIVFAPGSAGTHQEIFQDAAQNHYTTFRYASPMVFLGVEHWEHEKGLFGLLRRLAAGKPYGELLHLTDDPADAVQWILDHPPLG